MYETSGPQCISTCYLQGSIFNGLCRPLFTPVAFLHESGQWDANFVIYRDIGISIGCRKTRTVKITRYSTRCPTSFYQSNIAKTVLLPSMKFGGYNLQKVMLTSTIKKTFGSCLISTNSTIPHMLVFCARVMVWVIDFVIIFIVISFWPPNLEN